MLLGHHIIVRTDHKNLTYPNSTHTSDRVLRQWLLLEEYGVELEYIQGEKNVVADALSRLPTEEIFLLAEDDDFPLNLHLIAKQQRADEPLKTALALPQPVYKKIVRDSVKLYVNAKQETIYVPVSLRASLLQWYHLTLQHPGVKRMQATLKENFYWPGVDVAIEKIVKNCNTCQRCKLTAVKNMAKFLCQQTTNSPLGKKSMWI